MAESLIGVQLIRELVETIILTGRVKGIEPVSLMLIADPEHGKTSVVLSKDCEGVVVLSDVTGKGIQNLCQMKPEITHFVINDLTAVTAKKHNVSEFTMSMLMAMTEEGIRATAYPNGVQQFDSGKRGVIVCATTQGATDGRTWWVKSGFASRLLPFCFTHSTQLTLKIKSAIDTGRFDGCWRRDEKQREQFPIPKATIEVGISNAMAEEIGRIADFRATQLGEKGYRRRHQYRGLARGHALLRSWKKPAVNDKDIDFLRRVDPYVNYAAPCPL